MPRGDQTGRRLWPRRRRHSKSTGSGTTRQNGLDRPSAKAIPSVAHPLPSPTRHAAAGEGGRGGAEGRRRLTDIWMVECAHQTDNLLVRRFICPVSHSASPIARGSGSRRGSGDSPTLSSCQRTSHILLGNLFDGHLAGIVPRTCPGNMAEPSFAELFAKVVAGLV
jgi:hypothetical protein